MPLKLIAPKTGRTPHWTIRGTYLGISVERSARTGEKKIAAKILAKIKSDIECDAYAKPGAPTFASAARDYMIAGGAARFIEPILLKVGDRHLASINQTVIDRLAVELYPHATQATRNRQVYSPISAILKYAGVQDRLKRPKGWRGSPRVAFLTPGQANAIMSAARAKDVEFWAFLSLMLYTGARLSEATGLRCEHVDLNDGRALFPKTKNGEPRTVYLPAPVVAALACHPKGLDRKGPVFRFRKSGRLYLLLERVNVIAGSPIPSGIAFHCFRHTFGAWMRRYAGMDTAGLVATGAWKSRQAAAVYEHADVTAEARKADLLPIMGVLRK